MTAPLAGPTTADDRPARPVQEPVRTGPLSPARLLRLEGAALALVAVLLYAHADASWWLFAGLLMLPDLGMLGFVRGPRIGAFTYNLTHTLVVPLSVAAVGVVADRAGLLHIALIWVAHIGADRATGYGIKYPTHFKDTHLQRLADPGAGRSQ